MSDGLDRFTLSVEKLLHARQKVESGLDAFDDAFERAVNRRMALQLAPGEQAQKSTAERCLQLRGSMLGPFRLMLAQVGPIELKKGETVVVPIEGGVPPFRIDPLDDDDKVKANARLSALGGYEIEVKAVGDATAKARFFASDSSGGSAVFTVVIK